jgi:late competence protein required for DNA uptake (superfamily II DNA/RNA helicase)
MPVLPYQRTLYESLQNHKHIWIKKSRGIGVTEFLLRYVAWCCFSKYTANSRVCIVTGPRIDLAEDLIARFKGLFRENLLQNYRMASTVAIINSVKVEAFPSHLVEQNKKVIMIK